MDVNNLRGSQLGELQKQLLGAFPTLGDLRRLVQQGLDENLAAISLGDSLQDIIFDLLQWAGARGKTGQLIQAAVNANSGHTGLRTFAAQFGIVAQVATPTDPALPQQNNAAVPVAPVTAPTATSAPSLSTDQFSRLRQTLLDCGPFASNEQVDALFVHPLLKPWRNNLPQANARADRVDAVIAYLINQRRNDTKTNALVLLAQVLADKTDPDNECHDQLAGIAAEMATALQPGATARTIAPATAPVIVQQGNEAIQTLLFTANLEKVVASLPAIGRVGVPKIVGGQVTDRLPTGTGWLIAPDLALTCWHVVTAGQKTDELSKTDLDAQVANTLLTFDYNNAGQGVDYGVTALECSDPKLDYALLRLDDRADKPLAQRGVIALEPDAPLTAATQLYVLQHPKGQPQQVSAGRFVRLADDPNMILHSAPSDGGTSGAPVLNVTNWKAVALHNASVKVGIDEFRRATLIKAILDDIKAKNGALFDAITGNG